MKKMLYALVMAWKYRKNLADYRCLSALQKREVITLNPFSLKQEGVKLMILDFDGVLAAFGETIISPPIENWVIRCRDIFGFGNIFILTNRPTQERQQYLSERLPGVEFFWASRKKPYPDGILSIMHLKAVAPAEVLVIDDRLLTGILAAVLANVRGCYITEPLVSFRKRPIRELFFVLLRTIERFVFRRLRR